MKHAKQEETIKITNNKGLIKKIVLAALLCALSAFLFINRGYLTNRVTNNLFPEDGTEKQKVSMIGDHTIEQPFVAQTGSIGSVGIRFDNKEKNSATGTIMVELVDSKGNTVSSTDIDASRVRPSDYTKFILGGDSEAMNANKTIETYGRNQRMSTIFINKGESYTFRITAKDVTSDGDFDLRYFTYDGRSDGKPDTLTIDGETLEGTSLNMYTKNDIYSRNTVLMFIVLILAALLFVLLPFEQIDRGLAKLFKREGFSLSAWISRLFFITAPLAAYFIIHKYVDYDIAKFIRHLTNDSVKWLLNLIIIGFVWWLFYTITNSTRMTAFLTVLTGSAFGFTNYMLIMFRGTPLIYSDIAQLGTALQVANSYELAFSKYFLWAILLTGVWCIMCLALPPHKGIPLKKRIIPVVILALWGGVFYYSIFVSDIIERHEFRVSSFKPTNTYFRNGCALSFFITMKNAIVRAPEGYDTANIEALAEKYPSDAAEDSKVSQETPNVFIVMNESFSDLKVLGDFETNQDSLPFYRSISDNAIKGWMYSSVFGGSTANSEFECLTGFTMRYLPFQSVPYRSIIKHETPSLATYMKAMGYGGITAFHPGMANSYNRNVVYPLLGFDKHIAKEDLEEPEKIRDFVSDEYDYAYAESEYEAFRAEDADSPYFMHNVTIQNHGGYTYDMGVVDAGIEILSPEADFEMSGQFLNLMKLSDEALEKLIEYCSSVDEPTVIVLFGDHQPRIEEGFYSNLKAGYHPEMSDLEWSELTHKVPFMIWANYDIGADKKAAAETADAEDAKATEGAKEADEDEGDVVLSANYISPYLKQLLGMPMTGFDKYLLDLHEELPVINAICYEDAERNIYDPSEPSKFDERLNEYEQIQYNGLIDHKNRVDSFFNLK